MTKKNRFFIAPLSIIMALGFAYTDNAMAARAPIKSAPAARKSVAALATQKTIETPVVEQKSEPVVEAKAEPIIINKSSEFELAVSTVLESANNDNSFAEQIRKQRAALAAVDASTAAKTTQSNAIKSNTNNCDRDLRKCMAEKCGNDFTGCALDGDTIFGDKLNACKTKTSCSAPEFNMFVPEIRADRDMNVRLASYENVINCGNQYNACIVNECGTTYNKCLGKPSADAAIQKCGTIAKECTESDSGLASRFGTAIAKLRESAEKEVKADEQRMYTLRDSMRSACEGMGAMFDERTFDCIYTVNFFAGENQTNPTASRKRYAGDTFICMQEWFGINATTFMENAFRETRSQTAASSAMLGSGVGTAVGLISSGAINRALDTQKAKKELKAAEKAQKAEEKAAETTTDGTGTTEGVAKDDPTLVSSKEKTTVGADGSSTTKSKDTYSDGSTVNKVNTKDKDGKTTFNQTHTTTTDNKGNQSHTFETNSKGVNSTTKMTTDAMGGGTSSIKTTSTFDVKPVKADTSNIKINIPKPAPAAKK